MVYNKRKKDKATTWLSQLSLFDGTNEMFSCDYKQPERFYLHVQQHPAVWYPKALNKPFPNKYLITQIHYLQKNIGLNKCCGSDLTEVKLLRSHSSFITWTAADLNTISYGKQLFCKWAALKYSKKPHTYRSCFKIKHS